MGQIELPLGLFQSTGIPIPEESSPGRTPRSAIILPPLGRSRVSRTVNTNELIEALMNPDAYVGPVGDVERLETHISLLFFVGKRVYKVKKSVDLGFLDFTTLERRKFYCEEEVRLNRRLSPEVYLGVVPIVANDAGGLSVGGVGEAIEWAVEMQRLPAAAMLDARLEAGEVDNQMIRELAHLLAGFHAGARTGEGVDSFGAPEAVAELVRSTLTALEPFASEPDVPTESGVRALSLDRLSFLKDSAEAFLAKSRDLMEERIREGRIRDGHGDLHAGNICYRPGGIAIYDCIEFSEAFRCSDVACDLAFLAMDLDYRGFHAFAAYLVRQYQAQSADPRLGELIGFYKQYRAVVRAMVACVTARELEAGSAEARSKLAEAERYLNLATSYALPPCLVLMSGLPGSGKSTIARGLARPIHALVHRSDVRRKSLLETPAPIPKESGFSQGLYSPDRIELTYANLLESTLHDLSLGRSVIVDATFSKRDRREEFIRVAGELSVPTYVVETFASEEATRDRLLQRAEDRHEPSSADFSVYLEARQRYEPPTELPDSMLIRVDTEECNAQQAASLLLERRAKVG